ncbi:Uncharacterised protein [Porphyromonas crevioricanis]|uniref:Uncharacterized protein n=1 Tax=Porphyromonas crevioricanis TaxID=393921 RepID=A0A2X4PIF0_9PORP|nr:hypothetical protein HQ38_09470 [Porphyromonas crevioricanis]GAD07587.1 hypothetical protein PORCAN_1209 [Porphyromonas crevioricanis JCM 13913]SQH73706.1 Uncharacterised protein [Porphyromonas crevioricanis]
MKFSRNNIVTLVPFLGGLIGALFAIFDSLIVYMDTAPIDEMLLQSLLNSVSFDSILKIFVYAMVGVLLGFIPFFFYSPRDR